MSTVLELKAISELKDNSFYIPDYQRGYRWDKKEVNELLYDILKFRDKKDNNEIYCIQPLVVIKKNVNGKEIYRVVDGQQRLTTIYLIIKYLSSEHKPEYTIEYARDGSQEYLEKLTLDEYATDDSMNKNASDSKTRKNSNIDYYHMYTVLEAVSNWFSENSTVDRSDYLKTLKNDVNFIWYEVALSDEESESDAISKTENGLFSRLNKGKIPLTDSELIKAMFLNKNNFLKDGDRSRTDEEIYADQHQIAYEWDQIEYALQNDEFWLFLNQFQENEVKSTRIDFILDLLADVDLAQKEKDSYATFHKYYDWFNDPKDENGNSISIENFVLDTWKRIKNYYQIFDEWYHDCEMYHYVGYHINEGVSIKKIIDDWKDGKKAFIDKQKKAINKHVNDIAKTREVSKANLEELIKDYSFKIERKGISKPILLLHNIETIIQQNKKIVEDNKYNLPNFSKFPFHLYKKESWDVEHISPSSGDDQDDKNKIIALKQHLEFLKSSDPSNKSIKESVEKIDEFLKGNTDIDKNCSNIRAFCSEKIDSDIKAEVVKKYDDLIKEIDRTGDISTDADKNRIWNYTLLDASTNREYQNAIFPIKREFVRNKEQGIKKTYVIDSKTYEFIEKTEDEVAFVPIVTRYIFMKYYTKIASTFDFWSKEDAEDYRDDMLEKLKYYLK